jgi:hypothetical protein
MTLALEAVDARVFNRLLVDAEGQPVRDYLVSLGSGVGSILQADRLDADHLPPRPILAIRRLSTPLIEHDTRVPQYVLYGYDDPQHDYWRVTRLMTLIKTAYDADELDQPTGGVLGNVDVGDDGPQEPAPEYGLLATSLRIRIYAA